MATIPFARAEMAAITAELHVAKALNPKLLPSTLFYYQPREQVGAFEEKEQY